MKNKNRTSTYTIGLDLSDRKVAVCVLDAKGTIIEERSMPNEREHYKLLAGTYPKSKAVLETGSHSPWVSRLLAEHRLKPIVANARKPCSKERRQGLRDGGSQFSKSRPDAYIEGKAPRRQHGRLRWLKSLRRTHSQWLRPLSSLPQQ